MIDKAEYISEVIQDFENGIDITPRHEAMGNYLDFDLTDMDSQELMWLISYSYYRKNQFELAEKYALNGLNGIRKRESNQPKYCIENDTKRDALMLVVLDICMINKKYFRAYSLINHYGLGAGDFEEYKQKKELYSNALFVNNRNIFRLMITMPFILSVIVRRYMNLEYDKLSYTICIAIYLIFVILYHFNSKFERSVFKHGLSIIGRVYGVFNF